MTITPYKTILTICSGLIILFLLTDQKWTIYSGLAVGIFSLISEKAASLIEVGWLKIGGILGLIVPKILLTVIYYLILFPIAILYRITTSKDPLRLKNSSDSLFHDMKKTFDRSSFEKTW